MVKETLSIEEIEKLGYYDFMAYLDVPFFVIGGIESTERLAELCEISEGTKVLVVGCGTGNNAIHLAKTVGCDIIGVDIAKKMVERATQIAEEEKNTDKAQFLVGDAYNLPFEVNTFDVVLTEFTSQFLDIDKAFNEFARVTKPGGYVGLNELFRKDELPDEVAEKIKEGEKIFQELTELPFALYTPAYWKNALEAASLNDVKLEEHINPIKGASKKILRDMGGKRVMSAMGQLLVLSMRSKKLRNRFFLLSKAKRGLLRHRYTKNYVGYLLCAAKKT
jgi:SAM-dependent methyltransferase